MSTEKFKSFLEFQAKRSPLKVSEVSISWEDSGGRGISSRPSDFLDSVYLGKELQNTVVMERSVAAMLQHRLQELEKENERMRRRIRMFKFVLSGVTAMTMIITLWALLSTIY